MVIYQQSQPEMNRSAEFFCKKGFADSLTASKKVAIWPEGTAYQFYGVCNTCNHDLYWSLNLICSIYAYLQHKTIYYPKPQL